MGGRLHYHWQQQRAAGTRSQTAGGSVSKRTWSHTLAREDPHHTYQRGVRLSRTAYPEIRRHVLGLGFYQFTRPFVVATPFFGDLLAFFDSFLVRLPGGQVPQNATHGHPDSLPIGLPTARAGDPTGPSPAVRRPPRSLSTATR